MGEDGAAGQPRSWLGRRTPTGREAAGADEQQQVRTGRAGGPRA